MDPLSISASVAGLLGLVDKAYKVLEFVRSIRDAPLTIASAQAEVQLLGAALRSLGRYLRHVDEMNRQRAALIQIDQLIATLTDATLAFCSFSGNLEKLREMHEGERAISWPLFTKEIEEKLNKLHRHKESLTLMLFILQCESDLEASRSQRRLQALVEAVLAENEELKKRLVKLEDSFDAKSTFTGRQNDDDAIQPPLLDDINEDSDEASTIAHRIEHSRPAGTSDSIHAESNCYTKSFAFERVLEESWVYRRNERNECDVSFVSSAQRSHAWSVFSGFTLADISVLSVIALPLTPEDLDADFLVPLSSIRPRTQNPFMRPGQHGSTKKRKIQRTRSTWRTEVPHGIYVGD